MTTPAKSELDAARERLEAVVDKREEALRFIDKQSGWMAAAEPTQRAREFASDLRLVLDALKEAELSRDNLLKAQSVLLEQIEIQSERIEVLKERAQ